LRETFNHKKLFARFNNKYRPAKSQANFNILNKREKLWAIMTVLKVEEKEKFLNVKFVKKSCLEYHR
jgi:hypothetical protein